MSEEDYGPVRPTEETHPLARPETIRRSWRILLGVLAVTLLLQAAVPIHAYFEVDALFGFNAVFGFLVCVAMVIVSRILGWWLKRPDDYYPYEHVFLWSAGPEDPERPKFEKIDA